MRVLDPIIQPAAHLPAVQISQIPHRRWIGFQAIGNDRLGLSMTFQRLLQECQGRSFIPLSGDVALEDLALMINRPPQVMPLAVDVGYAALRVTNTSSRCHFHCRKPFIRLTR